MGVISVIKIALLSIPVRWSVASHTVLADLQDSGSVRQRRSGARTYADQPVAQCITIMFCECLDGATDECSLGKKEVLSPTYDMCEHKEGHGELGDDSIGF